jgi:hypothetical protein
MHPCPAERTAAAAWTATTAFESASSTKLFNWVGRPIAVRLVGISRINWCYPVIANRFSLSALRVVLKSCLVVILFELVCPTAVGGKFSQS